MIFSEVEEEEAPLMPSHGMMKLVGKGSVVITDDFTAYLHLIGDGWDHRVVNDSGGEYT